MGALVMAHGDDAGLRLPPRLAPVQVVVLVVRDDDGAGDSGRRHRRASSPTPGVRAQLDGRTDTSFGRRVVDWELKGVPVRVEVGPRELAEGEVVLVRRDTGTKTTVPLGRARRPRCATPSTTPRRALLDEALERRRAATVEVVAPWPRPRRPPRPASPSSPLRVLGDDGETQLNRAGVSVRCSRRPDGTLPGPTTTAPTTTLLAVVGRAY